MHHIICLRLYRPLIVCLLVVSSALWYVKHTGGLSWIVHTWSLRGSKLGCNSGLMVGIRRSSAHLISLISTILLAIKHIIMEVERFRVKLLRYIHSIRAPVLVIRRWVLHAVDLVSFLLILFLLLVARLTLIFCVFFSEWGSTTARFASKSTFVSVHIWNICDSLW